MWKPIETAPADTPVLVYGARGLMWAVARYTHDEGWEMQTQSRWRRINVPKLWHPLPASPDQEIPGRG